MFTLIVRFAITIAIIKLTRAFVKECARKER